METLIPSTAKQAKWLIVGGLLMTVVGIARGARYFSHGGLVFLMMAVLFIAAGLVSIIGSAIRLRRGDTAPSDGG